MLLLSGSRNHNVAEWKKACGLIYASPERMAPVVFRQPFRFVCMHKIRNRLSVFFEAVYANKFIVGVSLAISLAEARYVFSESAGRLAAHCPLGGLIVSLRGNWAGDAKDQPDVRSG